jgi:thioredoxin 1
MRNKIGIAFLAALVLLVGGACSQDEKQAPADTSKASVGKPLVTFVELGSVKCIPCKKMQPIMKEIEQEYPGTVKVVFHDVWTPEGKPYGQQFRIRVIPTQVFLDKDGVEYYRHEGYFPKEELIKVLEQKGVKP